MVLRDFVIVQALELELGAGFTVLTGETGAGKSILIDALQWVTGGRAGTHMIREGAQRCDVSAEFDLPESLHEWLHDAGFAVEDSLLLRRTLDAQGKSRAWVNASPATASQLRALGEQLLDIHGQHAWQSLTRPDTVRALLDAYAGLDTRPLTQAWQAWQNALQALQAAQSDQQDRQTQRDRLQWQIAELDKLNPLPDEWEALNTEHTRLSHAQGLLDAAHAALQTLQDDDSSVCTRVEAVYQTLQKQEHIEPYFQGLASILSSSLAQIEDVAHSLKSYLRKADLDPERLAELDARLSLWMGLARRLRLPPQELAATLADWRQELDTLEAALDLALLLNQAQATEQQFMALAQAVSAQRQRTAAPLAQTITEVIQDLGMSGGRFDVALAALNPPQKFGLEDVAFLVAGHPGSTPRPVQKVASGGELSRVALAIAVTTSQLGTAGTLIFDEVDSGVGGAVAETVGRLMQRLGRDRQVLAVTHLPQVAACADHHWVVRKQSQEGITLSSLDAVAGEARVAELARMLGGAQVRDSTLAHARDLLQPLEE
jgi:DNA repair protein RecN (Recombination protein N)